MSITQHYISYNIHFSPKMMTYILPAIEFRVCLKNTVDIIKHSYIYHIFDKYRNVENTQIGKSLQYVSNKSYLLKVHCEKNQSNSSMVSNVLAKNTFA